MTDEKATVFVRIASGALLERRNVIDLGAGVIEGSFFVEQETPQGNTIEVWAAGEWRSFAATERVDR